MAMRSVQSLVVLTRALLTCSMESSQGATRYYSEGKGKILSEEERAAENVYIKKMERERMEKQKQKVEKERTDNEKETADKKIVGTH